MKILVTGTSGQVAIALRERATLHSDLLLTFAGRPDYDLEAPMGLAEYIVASKPDVVISAAAYTAVDSAEVESEKAFAVNATAPGLISAAADHAGAAIIHVSTDFVFPGDGTKALTETDMTGPKSVYGASKLGGEKAVIAANPRHTILRTAWVYSPFGKNFVRTILSAATKNSELTVVSDQFGNPTNALDVADALFVVSRRLYQDKGNEALSGVFHAAGRDETNWAVFARAILEISEAHGGPSANVRFIKTSDWPTKAERPINSRLNSLKLKAVFGFEVPGFQTSLAPTVKRLLKVLT